MHGVRFMEVPLQSTHKTIKDPQHIPTIICKRRGFIYTGMAFSSRVVIGSDLCKPILLDLPFYYRKIGLHIALVYL